jgi:hypothetical protein
MPICIALTPLRGVELPAHLIRDTTHKSILNSLLQRDHRLEHEADVRPLSRRLRR